MKSDVERQLEEIYKAVYKKVFKNVSVKVLIEHPEDVATFIFRLKNADDYQKFCQKYSKELARKGLNKTKGRWKKYYETAKLNHQIALPATYNEFEIEMYQKTMEECFNKIKSIPEEILKVYNYQMTQDVIDEILLGKKPRGTLLKTLEEHNLKNARLIARTESARLQSFIIENKATSLGCVAYIWRSTNDQRTRPSHTMMNDVVVFWRSTEKEKPHLDGMYGNAGQFPNCRCSLLPIMDERDLTKATYKVYNYKTGQVDHMNKSDLLKAIDRKEL